MLSFWLPSAFAAECALWKGDAHTLKGKTIGSITVDAGDIFDTSLSAESRWIHRVANDLHYQTKRKTVERQLLFAEGDVFSQRVLEESERLLRSRRYLVDADIRVLQICGDEVVVQVRTTDAWSTVPELSVSQVAGESQRTVSLEENNLLGLGQELSLSYEEELGQVNRSLSYTHRDWAGRRQTLDLGLQNNQDGEGYYVGLSKPYFSLSDTYSWGVEWRLDRSEAELYDAAEVSETMGMELRYVDVSRSWSEGLMAGELDRWTVGLRMDERKFYRVDDTESDELFDNHREHYPYIRLDYVQENYVKTQHIHQLANTEDVNLGMHYSLEMGYSARALGADDDSLLFKGTYQRGKRWREQSLWLSESWLSTTIVSGDSRQQRIGAKAQLHTRISEQEQFFMELMFDSTHSAYQEEQLAIGGDSGLRGYAYKEQTGNRLARISTELRHYPNWNPWHLLHFGVLLFSDYGAAWQAGGAGPKWLWDVGAGIRLGSTRSSSGKVLHLDFALPDGKGSPQWTATAKMQF